MKRKTQRESSLIWWIAGLWLLGTLVYLNSFEAPFVFDDLLTIQKNTGVRFGEFNWNLLAGRSLLYLTFTLNYIWTEQAVWSYHLVNLLLHLANGGLVFLVAYHCFKRSVQNARTVTLYAFGAASFFLLHPVQTQSVTYISSRSELLSTFFYLIAFFLFARRDEKKIGFVFSLPIAVSFLLALSSKETAITLPAVLAAYDLIFISQGRIRSLLSRWRFYTTFAIGGLAATYYIATVTLRGSIGRVPGHLAPYSYFLTELRVIVRYIYLTFLPIGLNLDYEFTPSVSIFEWKVLLSAVFLAAIAGIAWVWRKTHPVYSFSIVCFFLTLAPTSSFVPILDVIFEHRLYLPMTIVCLSFPFLIVAIAGYVERSFRFAVNPAVLGGVLLATLGLGAVLRNHIWADEVRLFADVVEKSPGKQRSYNGLAFAYYKKGDYANAIKAGELGAERLPEKKGDFAEMLGQMYLKSDRLDDAIRLFEETIPLFSDPRRIAFSYNNLGVAYLYKWNALQAREKQMSVEEFNSEKLKILEPAAAAFKKCYEMDSDMMFAWDSFINVSWYLGTADPIEAEALAHLETQETFKDLYAAARIAQWRENFARADELFTRAEKVAPPTRKLVLFNHGYSLSKIGQSDRAIEKYLGAIREDGIFVEAHHNVGQIYMQKNQDAEAISHLSEVLRWNPAHRSANISLAKLFARQGDKSTARRHLETILRGSQGDQEAMQLWQNLGL